MFLYLGSEGVHNENTFFFFFLVETKIQSCYVKGGAKNYGNMFVLYKVYKKIFLLCIFFFAPFLHNKNLFPLKGYFENIFFSNLMVV